MAGTRWWIIQSFLIPLLLYVIIVCLCYGFFLVHHDEDVEEAHHGHYYLMHQKPFISSLLWKQITDMIWVNVYLPLFIYIPFIHQQPQPQVVVSSSLLYRSNNRTNDRIQMNLTVEKTNDESKSMLHRITTTTPPPWNNNNNNKYNNLNHDKIYITLILDRTVTNWNEYLLQIQIWMDNTNNRQQQQQESDNDLFVLSALCPDIHPIQIQNVYRTDVIRNMTISTTTNSSNSNNTHDSNLYHRSLSTSDRNLIALLSDDMSSFVPTSSSSSHIVLYIPNETTFLTTHTTNTTTTTTTLVQISNENDSTTLSYFGIINPKHKHHHNDDKDITSKTTNETVSLISNEFLDQIYNQFYSKCFHMVDDDVDALIDDTAHSNTNHDRSILDQKSLYYHRTFTIWYESILNRLDSIYLEMLEYQTTSQYSSYVYKPWSFQSLLIPIQNKLHTLINDHFVELTTTGTLSSSVSPSTSSWLYNNTNYHETYQRLHYIEVTVQQLEQDMNDMKQTVVQNQSRILDLTIVIHNLPMEQYLAIFGPLLFPLIIPLCITFVREYIRYRKYNHRAVVR